MKIAVVKITKQKSFLDYVITKLETGTIACPCVKCVNIQLVTHGHAQRHLLAYGWLEYIHFAVIMGRRLVSY